MFDLIVKGGTLPDGTVQDIGITGKLIAAVGRLDAQAGGGVHADSQAGDVDSLADHPNGDEPGGITCGELGDPGRSRGVVADDDLCRDAAGVANQRSDGVGVLLVHRDDEAACFGSTHARR